MKGRYRVKKGPCPLHDCQCGPVWLVINPHGRTIWSATIWHLALMHANNLARK